jgi:2-hydroxychromene-2-carboxylate isomerase
MLLGGVFRGIGAGDGPMATLSPQKRVHNEHDMHRWADRFGVPFQVPAAHPMSTVLALRTLLALPHASWPAAIEALFAAYWQRGDDITRADVIEQALCAAGIADELARTALACANDPDIKRELRQRTDEAISLGIFGAPAWILRDGPEPMLIWGQDRMAWVEAALAGWKLSGPPPGGARSFAASAPAAPGKTLDVYFDVASPYAYLGLTQLPGLITPGVRPRLVPILLGALFRDIGQANVPLLAMPPPKQKYLAGDMERWASWWGVPFEFPRKFPQRTVTAQRLCVLAAAEGFATGASVAAALARAMWAEQRDLEDPASLREILLAAAPAQPAAASIPDRAPGLPEGLVDGWLARTQDPEIKTQLAANTAAARDAGVFGVPTFVVDGQHLFWGQDRLDLVASALAGWAVPGAGQAIQGAPGAATP